MRTILLLTGCLAFFVSSQLWGSQPPQPGPLDKPTPPPSFENPTPLVPPPPVAPPPVAPSLVAPLPQNPVPRAPIVPQAPAWYELAKPREPAPDAGELQKLLVARYNAALAAMKGTAAGYSNGQVTFGDLAETIRQLGQAEFELSDKPADQIAASEQYLELTKKSEQRVKALFDSANKGGEADKYYQAKYMRLDAEIQLLRAKRKAGLAK